jgi:hypothetical protein
MPVSFLAYYYSALKMETCSFKTLVEFNGLQIIISQKTELFNQNNVYLLHSCGCLGIPMVFPHQAVVLTKAKVAFYRSVMCILVFVVNADNAAIIFMWVIKPVCCCLP